MGSNPAGCTIFFVLKSSSYAIHAKSKHQLGKQICPQVLFLFALVFFASAKMGLLTFAGLPILQKISLRRRESRLAARALPSAVKSIFRRPRSAAFRRHPPYSCLEYGSVDYIIFAPALRRASRSLSNPAGCTILDTYPQEFITFADFLLYVVKCCKNQPIAV